jgi:hypothetical protein
MTIRELMNELDNATAEAPDADAFLDMEVHLVDCSGNTYPLADALTLRNDPRAFLVAHRFVGGIEPTPELIAELDTWNWK